MIITDGEKILTLEELAQKICRYYEGCAEDGCPAAGLCGYKHNGMIEWLRKVTKK